MLRLECVDHVGLYISNYRDYKIEQMLDRLSCSVLLQDDHNRLSILLPTSLPMRPRILSQPFSADILFVRSSKFWRKALHSGHFVYPIHLSREFIGTPTLASALYLLLLRLQTRRYKDVLLLADSCITDGEVWI